MPLLQQLDTRVSGLACPWGVDEPSPLELPPGAGCPSPTASAHSYGNPAPICTSWNAGSCRFRDSCRLQHICSACFRQGHRAPLSVAGGGGGGRTLCPAAPVRSNNSAVGGCIAGRARRGNEPANWFPEAGATPRPGVEGR